MDSTGVLKSDPSEPAVQGDEGSAFRPWNKKQIPRRLKSELLGMTNTRE